MRNNQRNAVLKWLLKHYIYLGILAFAVSFAILPMHGMMKLGTVRQSIKYWQGSEPERMGAVLNWTREMTRNFLFYPLNLETTCAIFGTLGFGSAMALFGHLFSRKQSMMYAGLPMTRSRDFGIRTACFLILTALPVLLCAMIYPLAVQITGMTETFDAGLYLREAASIEMTVVYGYAAGALSAQIFGNLWAAALGGGILIGSAEMIYGSWYSFTKWYLHTMRPESPVHMMKAWSPVVSLYKGLYQADQFNWIPGAAVILIFLAAGWAVSRKNKPERAGNTLNFMPAQLPARGWITLLGGSAGGWVFANFFGREISLYLGIAAGAAIASLGGRMLEEQNLRVRLRGWGLPAVCLGCMLLLCLGLRADVLGYDSYLPGADQVRAVSFGKAYYEETSERQMSRFTERENLEAARRWIQLMRDRMAEERKERPFQPYPDISERIVWELAGGGRAQRQYGLPEDPTPVLDEIRQLSNSSEFRQGQAAGIPDYRDVQGSSMLAFNSNLQDEEFREIYGFSPRINWERLNADSIREAMRADYLEKDWEEMQGTGAARVWFYENNEMTMEYKSSETFQIQAGDERTIRAIWGKDAEQVLAYLNGAWADTDEILVFRCEYEEDENGDQHMTGYKKAASPEDARAMLAKTTQCGDAALQAPVNPDVWIRVYSKPSLRRWAENEGMEGIPEDPEFLDRLPETEDIYSYTTFRERSDL